MRSKKNATNEQIDNNAQTGLHKALSQRQTILDSDTHSVCDLGNTFVIPTRPNVNTTKARKRMIDLDKCNNLKN